MEGVFRFLDFPVYQSEKKWYICIGELCEKLHCGHEIKSQISRASLSISLNIAEGSAKNSDKDFARFLHISIGSIHESVACLNILAEQKYISEEVYQKFLSEAESLCRQLGGFIKHLIGKNK